MNDETDNDVAAKCVETSNQLRRFLFSGEEITWSVRRDIAATAIRLLDLSNSLEEV
jgi:hypothetical protein